MPIEESTSWYVVHCNPRCEQRAKESLSEAGFSTYLPVGRKLIVHHRSKKEIEREFPLLVGYLFVAVPRNARHWGYIRVCDGVKGVLGINGLPLPVPACQVEAIHEAQFLGRFDDTRKRKKRSKHGFRRNQRVRIANGPFSGFVAMVHDPRGLEQIKVMAELFGRMTEVTVPVDGIELAA